MKHRPRLGKVRDFPVDATGLVRRRRHRRLFISSFFGAHTCEVIPLTVTPSVLLPSFSLCLFLCLSLSLPLPPSSPTTPHLLSRSEEPQRSPPIPLTQPGRAALEKRTPVTSDALHFSPLGRPIYRRAIRRIYSRRRHEIARILGGRTCENSSEARRMRGKGGGEREGGSLSSSRHASRCISTRYFRRLRE